jgi:phage terminase large subunit GpA-like protein
VQHDRIEVIVRGWAKAEESYLIERVVLMGDPSADQIWSDLDSVLLERTYEHESGTRLRIFASCVDSGDQQDRVMRYCAPRFRRRVFCIKGGANYAAPFIPKRPTRNNKHRCPLFLLGTNAGKALLYGRLKIVGTNLTEPTAYRYRFNMAADRDYFDQLTAEKAERKMLNGRWMTVYTCPAHRRNEVLDCEVYALAALTLSNVPRETLGKLIGTVEQAVAPIVTEQQADAPEGIQPAKSLIRHAPRRGFVTGWK